MHCPSWRLSMANSGLRRCVLGAYAGLIGILLSATGCGGNQTYTDTATGAYRFECPTGFTIDTKSEEIAGGQGVQLTFTTAQGAGTISSYSVIRYVGLSKAVPADRRDAMLLNSLKIHTEQMQGKAVENPPEHPRPYGATRRVAFAGKGPHAEPQVVVEAFQHGDDLYLLMIAGDSVAIESDPAGEVFFQNFQILK